jgi:hypothetical protein
MTLLDTGFYIAKKPCPLCKDSKWSSPSGAHLKSLQHFAALYGVTVKDLKKASNVAPDLPEFVYKCLIWIPAKGILKSPSNQKNDGSSEYIPGSVTLATCEDGCDEIPGKCGCGIYTFQDPMKAWGYNQDKEAVVAVLRYGGKTLIHGIEGVRTAAVTVVGLIAGRKEHPGEQFVVEAAAKAFNVPIYPLTGDAELPEDPEED